MGWRKGKNFSVNIIVS